MDTIRRYTEFMISNISGYFVMILLLFAYALLVIWNRDDALTIVIMTITYVIGYSVAQFQKDQYERATKINVDFRSNKTKK